MYSEIKFHLRANVTLLRDLVVHPGLVENSSESFHAWFMLLIFYQSTESSFHQIIYLLDVLKSSGIQVTYFVLPVIPRFVTTKPGNRLTCEKLVGQVTQLEYRYVTCFA